MNSRRALATSATFVLVLALTSSAFAATPAAKPAAKPAPPKPAPAKSEVAVFAMGCFWCAETAFEGQPGVISAVSGYTGGRTKNPTYEEVGSGTTGHAESIEVTFDPAKTSYEKVLDLFWHNVDPTQKDGQFCDHGNQYRSAVFYADEAQHRLALASEKKIEESGILKAPIVTQIVPLGPFTRAEEYHQDFYKKDPERYYSYREGCGRDRRLAQLWGGLAGHPAVH